MRSVLLLMLLLWGLGMVYGLGKPLPPGVSTAGMNHRRGTVEFLYDLAWEPAGGGKRIYEARIFSALLAEIAQAEDFIILDMFLFNDLGAGPEAPPLAAELTAALLAKKAAAPELPMVVISDEINTGYGSYPSPHLEQLRAAGIEVVLTDLTRLRDSNPIYSGLWRSLLQWLEPLAGRLPLTNIFDPGRPILRALAAAAQRGATVRLILDPNRDAFGHDKHGLPNRPTAARLKRQGGENLAIRWYQTRGEQFHPKLLLIEGRQRAVLFGGSANLTRRNIGGYNLESGLLLTAPPEAPAIGEAAAFCNRLWHNRDGLYTVDYQRYADPSPLKEALVIFQEITGLGSF